MPHELVFNTAKERADLLALCGVKDREDAVYVLGTYDDYLSCLKGILVDNLSRLCGGEPGLSGEFIMSTLEKYINMKITGHPGNERSGAEP